MPENTQDKFQIETQFQIYLHRSGFTRETMHPIQYIETRRAFYGAAGQMLVLLRDDISELPDEAAVEQLSDMLDQCNAFWINEMINATPN